MILGICNEPSVMNVMRYIILMIKILKTAIPIVLIISVMIKFASAITKHDDDLLAKATKSVVPNLIAAVLIFLVPTFVDIVVKISFPNSDYTKCISGITIDSVKDAYNKKMDKLISNVEESLDYLDYSNALAYLPNIKDPDKKQEYEDKLNAIKELIDANSGSTTTCNNKNNYAKINYSGFTWHPYNEKSGPVASIYSNITPYAIWAPDNVSDLNEVSLPLMVWLNGSGELSYNMTINQYVKAAFPKVIGNWSKYNLDNIPAIIVAPQGTGVWNGSAADRHMESIKALIEYAEKTYNIDESNIVLIGHSLGGNGVIYLSYDMQKKYSKDYFNALVTMSGTNSLKYPSNDLDSGYNYFSKKTVLGYSEHEGSKPFFTWTGKEENFHLLKGVSHGSVPEKAMTMDSDNNGVSDLIETLFGKNEKCEESTSPGGGDNPGGENPAAKITAKCTGEYQNIYGLAKLDVTVTSGTATNYKFLIDGKIVQDSNSTSYTADSEYVILINPKVTIKSSNGQSTTINCSVKHSDYIAYNAKGYYFSAKQAKDKTGSVDNPYPSNRLPYYIHIPENVSANESLPLIIGLHGGYGIGTCNNGQKEIVTTEGTQTNHYFKNVYYYNKRDKYSINNGKDNDLKAVVLTISNNRCSWNGDMYGAMNIIHAIIKKYNIDLNHVVLTGVSQGGAGTLYLGFLEEQILYKANGNDTTLSSVAAKYNTTVEAIESYNKKTKHSISYSNSSSKTLKSGSVTIIRSRNSDEPGSIFSLLMPFSPAQVGYRVGFVNEGGSGTPPHTLKTPIWVITSNDEYAKVQSMAKEVTTTYDKLGDARYTVLTKLRSPHDSDTAFFNRTSAAKWVISATRGNVKVKNNSEIDAIEKQMGSNYAQTWRP